MLNISPSIFWPISALLQIRPFVKLDQKIPLPCKESRNLHLCILLLLHSWQISQVDTVVPNTENILFRERLKESELKRFVIAH